jgi:hypothetical protein
MVTKIEPFRDGDVVNVHHQAGLNELTIQDNHPASTSSSQASKKETPMKLVEDDEFDEGFFFSSR